MSAADMEALRERLVGIDYWGARSLGASVKTVDNMLPVIQEALDDARQEVVEEREALTEWGVRMPGGRVSVCPGEEFARRYARNDPAAREVVTRTVTPWESPGEA